MPKYPEGFMPADKPDPNQHLREMMTLLDGDNNQPQTKVQGFDRDYRSQEEMDLHQEIKDIDRYANKRISAMQKTIDRLCMESRVGQTDDWFALWLIMFLYAILILRGVYLLLYGGV